MESINKFKVFTIIIIFTFVFVIAAIYTNTKDVTADKAGNGETIQSEESDRYNLSSSYDMKAEIGKLHQRIDELSTRLDNTNRHDTKSGSTNLKCRIAGTLGSRGMEEMSSGAAVNDARVNGNDLVVLCSF